MQQEFLVSLKRKYSYFTSAIRFIDNFPKTICSLGINTGMLRNFSVFNQRTANLIIGFLQQYQNPAQRPICLVAHNGKRFDFPILNRQLRRTVSKIVIIFVFKELIFMELLNFIVMFSLGA